MRMGFNRAILIVTLLILASTNTWKAYAISPELERGIEFALPTMIPLSDASILVNITAVGGFFAEEELDVKVRSFWNEESAAKALLADEVDIAVLRGLSILRLIEEGADIKAFMVISNSTPYSGILASQEIKSIDDLREQSISISNFDALSLVPLTPVWLPDLEPPEVEWVAVDSVEERMQALSTKEVDAAMLPTYYALEAIEKNPDLDIIPNSDPNKMLRNYWGLMLTARSEFLKKEVEITRAVMRAVMKAMEAVYRDKELWRDMVLEVWPDGNKELIEQTWEPMRHGFVLEGTLPVESYNKFAYTYFGAGILKTKLTFNQAFDNNPDIIEKIERIDDEDTRIAISTVWDDLKNLKDVTLAVRDELKTELGKLSVNVAQLEGRLKGMEDVKEDIREIRGNINTIYLLAISSLVELNIAIIVVLIKWALGKRKNQQE